MQEIGEWFYHFQGLVGGVLALIAALGSVIWLHLHRGNNIKRKNYADRAGMPRALSEVLHYCRLSINHTRNLQNLWKENKEAKTFLPEYTMPEYPQQAFDKIQMVVENASKHDAKIISDLIAFAQVQNARLADLLPEMNGEGAYDRNYIFSDSDFHGKIFDAIGLYKFGERLFDYARLKEDKIGDLCDKDSVRNTLYVSFNIDDNDLFEYVDAYWPPGLSRS